MTFTRRIKKGDRTYVYRVQTYREKGTGKVKQNTEYLGKEIIENGKTILIPPKRKNQGAREILEYGQHVALFKLAEKFRLPQIIQDSIGHYTRIDDIGLKTTILAINKITAGFTIGSIANWYSRSSLKTRLDITSDDFTEKKVRNILELLVKHNPDVTGLIEEGLAARIKELNGDDLDTVVYDLTALTYHGDKNELAQYGHAYRTSGEKQINVVIGITKKNMLPLHHKVLSGKIVSVSTIHSFVKELKVFGVEKAILVLDRGFYSKRNVREILDSKHDVIGALSSNLKLTKEALTNSVDIENSRNRIRYPGDVLFSKEFVEDDIRVIVYHDPARRSRQLQRLYEDLNEIENKLDDLVGKEYEQYYVLKEEIKGICGVYLDHFKIKYENSTDGCSFTFRVKHKSVQRVTNRFGKTVLFTSTSLDAASVLKLYREKDVVEKVFQLMKGKGMVPINTSTESSTKARVLLNYLGYLLLSLLRQKLNEEITLQKALTRLGLVREVVYKDNSHELPELTKNQKEILKKLDML